ncbi:Plasma membrane calcium-transporting ATPase 2 [Giardia duodenalis]|uniref:Plasma membrane calcium-transporting ATPase 2 n=1 Tax=Giardia intestinalis (strain ATCC 50803 / WB clone C6) TaxID=184922 RepID=A8B9T9_GIAIC|nr:Plasma membrane calcium-transporting ATPase 2 [Giardia intestinalis]KAE8306064.1 Plasma membrane calcium-transporting ATPase 2 [Giardia intestinalis]|eukprot:XP_001708561.1 Plasma membrane calcium-transporting ATPase 2 [Giardia lamblia ATCC 50803]
MSAPTTADLLALFTSRDLGALRDKYGSIEGLAKELGSDPATGLLKPTVLLHRKTYGSNTMPLRRPRGYGWAFLRGLKDPVVIVLTVISILLITFGLLPDYTYDVYAWIDGVITLVMLLLLLSINAAIVYHKDKVLWQANVNANKHTVTVVRDGRPQDESSDSLVVGDVVCLTAGSFVPADGVLLINTDVKVITDLSTVLNGSLTSTSVTQTTDPFLSAGTYISDATEEVRMLVLVVGEATILGKTRLSKGYQNFATDLQKRLEKLYRWTTIGSLIGSLIIFLVMAVRFFLAGTANDNRQVTTVVRQISIALIVFIVTAPEALQMALSLSLSYSMKTMCKDGIHIKNYDSIENLACCTHLVLSTNTLPSTQDELLQASSAGIKLCYASSDPHDIAVNKAKVAGLLDQDSSCVASVRASELFSYPQETINMRLKETHVISEITAQDLHRLVCFLRSPEDVVAYIGTDNLHAAALRTADVGLSTRLNGTDLCKDSSDIVLEQGSFSDLIEAIRWGSNIVHNVRKFIQFQYTAGVLVILLTLLSSAIFNIILFSAAQLLYINLVIDALAAFAFGGEPPHRTGSVPPLLRRTYKIFNPSMTRNIYISALFTLVSCILALIPDVADKLFGIPSRLGGPSATEDEFALALANSFKQTCAYNILVISLIFNMFWARTTYREMNVFVYIKKSINMWIVIAVIACTHVVVMMVPGVTFVFKTFNCLGDSCLLGGANGVVPHPLKFFSIGWQGWIVTLVLGALVLPCNLLFRLLPMAREYGYRGAGGVSASKL